MINFKSNEGLQLDFSDVLLVPRVQDNVLLTRSVASRSDIDLRHPIHHHVPIIVANMDSIGTFQMASHLKQHKLMVAMLKDYSIEDWETEIANRELDPRALIPTFGLRDLPGEIHRLKTLLGLFPTIQFVCLDVANGYMAHAATAVRAVKEAMPDVKICAGNVVDDRGLVHLAEAGASLIKVGIGSGGVCLTRQKTGIGFPQFSAVHNLSELAETMGVQLVSDGGITCPGDVVKALAAGADFVMAGSYFAGHNETGATFHGMSSDQSRSTRGETLQGYRASEGREVILKPKGPLEYTMRDLLGGLRSACSYLAVTSLADLKHAPIRAIQVARQLNRIGGISEEG